MSAAPMDVEEDMWLDEDAYDAVAVGPDEPIPPGNSDRRGRLREALPPPPREAPRLRARSFSRSTPSIASPRSAVAVDEAGDLYYLKYEELLMLICSALERVQARRHR